jgi:hypothetical protein
VIGFAFSEVACCLAMRIAISFITTAHVFDDDEPIGKISSAAGQLLAPRRGCRDAPG